MIKYLPLISFLFIFLLCCNDPDEPFIEPEPEPEPELIDSTYAGFNMYYLKDEKLNGTDVADMKLSDLELQKTPFVSQGNIQYYDTSSHVIHLFEAVTLPGMKVSVYGKPFVVVTDTIRHYLGVIWPMYSSASYWGPIIDDTPRFYPNDIIKISMGRAPTPQPDPRLNNVIIQTLKGQGVFHAGISFTIDSLAILKNDLASNSASVLYRFKIVNNDDLNLYVFDPFKMKDVFYWYHNSLSFFDGNKFYQSKNGGKKPDEGTDILSWFTKINSKDSVLWTLQKEGYPYIPPGNYECSFSFSGLNSIGKATRIQPDGNIWIGKITAKYTIKIP